MKTVYQAEDGEVFENQAACVFYEAMEGCKSYITSYTRKDLANHIVAKLYSIYKENLPNETLSPSIQTQLYPIEPLNPVVWTPEDREDATSWDSSSNP